jgi:hypothetical protein
MRGGMLWFNFKRSLPILKRSAGFRGFRRWPKYTVPFQHFPSLSSFNILYLSRNCFRNGSQWWLPAPLWKFSWFHSIAAETHPFHFHNKTERNMENQKVVCIRKSVVRGHREMRLLEILPSLFLCSSFVGFTIELPLHIKCLFMFFSFTDDLLSTRLRHFSCIKCKKFIHIQA